MRGFIYNNKRQKLSCHFGYEMNLKIRKTILISLMYTENPKFSVFSVSFHTCYVFFSFFH